MGLMWKKLYTSYYFFGLVIAVLNQFRNGLQNTELLNWPESLSELNQSSLDFIFIFSFPLDA